MLKELKELRLLKKQKYEEAAKLRDDEKRIEKSLAEAQEKWEEDIQNASRNRNRRQCC